jgi:hypothetical protein
VAVPFLPPLLSSEAIIYRYLLCFSVKIKLWQFLFLHLCFHQRRQFIAIYYVFPWVSILFLNNREAIFCCQNFIVCTDDLYSHQSYLIGQLVMFLVALKLHSYCLGETFDLLWWRIHITCIIIQYNMCHIIDY